MSRVNCRGSEQRLSECSHTTSHSCTHSRDASVTCQNLHCRDGDVRLVRSDGVTGVTRGRVEVCKDETWGTVCDHGWSRSNARVVCTQLGFLESGAYSYYDALLGQGSGQILLSNVACNGRESRLFDCTSDARVAQGCSHADDVGVSCRTSSCSNGALSLVDGQSDHEGRLEMCYNNDWGTICDDSWTQSATNVACRQLGLGVTTHMVRLSNNAFSVAPSSVSTVLDDVRCSGLESTLLRCSHRTQPYHNCRHSDDISIRCGECEEGGVRLVNGASEDEGRVEVCLSGRWGTVCSSGWDSTSDGHVVCTQLGYQTAAMGTSSTLTFSRPIIMNQVACSGQESALTQCGYSTSLSRCSHRDDSQIQCLRHPPGPVQRFSVRPRKTSILVQWSSPLPSSLDRKPSSITQYLINCYPDGHGEDKIRSEQTLNTVTVKNVTGLLTDTWYACCTAADSSRGSGDWTCQTSATRTPKSSPPWKLRGFATSSRSITITWAPPLIPRGTILEYRMNITDTTTLSVRNLTSILLTIEVTGLRPYTYHTISVAAFTEIAVGCEVLGFPADISVKTPSDVPDATPSVPEPSDVSSSSFSVSWEPPPPENSNGDIIYYILQLENLCNHSSTNITVEPMDIPYTLLDLKPFTMYHISVWAATINGTGPPSSQTVQTHEDVPSGPPLNVNHSVLGPTSLTVTWSPPGCQDQGGEINNYSLQLNDTVGTRMVSGTSHTVEGLLPNHVYSYRVAAFTVGLGPYSQWRYVTMPGDGIGHLESTSTNTSISLMWESPDSGQGLSYTVQCTETNTGRVLPQHTTSNTEITITQLHPHYTYMCNLTVSTPDSSFSDIVNVTTKEDVPSRAPGGISVDYIGSRNVTLSWSELAMEDQNGIVRDYLISVVPTEPVPWLQPSRYAVASPQLSYTVPDLHPHSYFNVCVAAFTIAAGPYSNKTLVQTKPEPPSTPPQGLSAVPQSPYSLLISWQPPPLQTQNGVIQFYTVRVESAHITDTILKNTSDLEMRIEGLHPHYAYRVSVAATTVGPGPFTHPATNVIMPESPPTGSPSMTVLGVTSDTIQLQWTEVPEEHRNGEITNYILEYFSNRNGSVTVSAVLEHALPAFPCTSYRLRIAAVNSAGQGPPSDNITCQTLESTPTDAPVSVRFGAIASTSIQLYWGPPPSICRIQSYTTHCSELETNRSLTETSTTTSITLTQLHPYYTYSCRVAAVTVGEGQFSDFIINKTLEDAPSAPPNNIMVTNITPTSLSILWTEPVPSTHNGVIKRYVVRVFEQAMSSSLLYNLTTNSTNLTVTGLHPFRPYEISVAAFTIAPGPYNSTSVTTEEDVPTAAPMDLSATPASTTELFISWRPPPKDRQNGRIRYYNVSLYDVATGEQSWYNTQDSRTDWTVSSLEPNHVYCIRVAAVTVGQGNFTAEEKVQMLGPPVNLTVKAIGPNYVLLHWAPPPEASGNGIIQHYLVSFMEGNSSQTARNLTSSSSRPSMYIGYLRPSTTYICSVAAVTVLVGPFSTGLSFTTQPHIPGMVQSLVAEALSPRSMNISWLPPVDGEGAGETTDYQVNVTLLGTPPGERYSTRTESTSVVLRGLRPNYYYQCMVVPRTSAGPGPTTQTLLQLPPDVPTSSPVSVNALPSDPTTLHLYWSPPPVEDQNGDITHYGINITEINQGLTHQYNTSGPQTSFVVPDLHPYHTYQYTMTVFTVVGGGPYSPADTVQMPPTAPSSPPVNFSLHEVGSSYALLQWAPPPLPDRNGVIEHYQIHLNSSQSLSVISLNTAGPETHILIDTLQPRTQYTCSVTAFTVSPGPPSTSIHFTTNASVPGTVEGLRATPLSPRSANISWHTPLNGQTYLDFAVTLTPLYRHSRSRHNTTAYSSMVVDGLQPGAFYLCIVAARTEAGLQQSVSTILMEQPPDVPDGFPRNVHAVPIDARTLHLVWSPPPLEEQNGEIVRYGVNLTELETGELTQYLTSDSVTSFTIPLLHPHYHYKYAVTAFTSVGHGPYSLTYLKQMPPDVPEGFPLNVTVENVSPRVVALQWLPPLPETRNGVITGYNIRIFDIELETRLGDREIGNVSNHTLSGLHTAHLYEFSVAARTAVGHGPFSKPYLLLTLHDVPLVVGVSAERISATEIRVSWPVVHTEPPILYYTVKYHSLESEGVRLRRETDVKLIDTKTNLTVEGLDPTLTYSVAVDANTISGTGEFSKEITVGLSDNKLFQLFLRGAIDCQEWVVHHISAKLTAGKASLSLELEISCQCQFLSSYLLFHTPRCLSAHTDWLILWGRIIGTNHTPSADIHRKLQEWSDSQSKLVVEGVHLATLEFCTVFLNEGELPFCEVPTVSPADIVDGPPPPPSPVVTYVVVSIVAVMFVIILVVLVCLATVTFYKKRVKAKDKKPRFHATLPIEEYDMATGTIQKTYDPIYDTADGVYYETVLDSGAPHPPIPPPLPPLPPSLPGAQPRTSEQPLTTQDQEDTTVPSSDNESPETQSSTGGSQFYPNLARNSTTATTTHSVSSGRSRSILAKEEQPTISTHTEAPDPFEAPSTYQPLTLEPQSPNAYQTLLKQTSDTQESQESTPTDTDYYEKKPEQEPDEEYVLPAFTAGYKLLGIRNDYQFPQPAPVKPPNHPN